MSEPKLLARAVAREHFYCPGPFNEDKFAKDYALFIVLRKQCLRHQKSGELNHGLALNNTVILLNTFGKTAVNEVVRLLYSPDLQKTANAFLKHLRSDVPVADAWNEDVLGYLVQNFSRYNNHTY